MSERNTYSLDFIRLPVDLKSPDGAKEPIYSSQNFDVYIGVLPEDKLPQFIVLNTKYGIVEFACNNEYMFREWIDSMEARIRDQVIVRPKADVVQLHS